jgi:hypothetical protein
MLDSMVCSWLLIASVTIGLPLSATTRDANTDPAERWSYEGGYAVLGLAPFSGIYIDGFTPGLRYDFETGLHWRRRRTTVFVGADVRVQQYFGRNRPGGGADGVITVSIGHVYGRLGVGAMAGVPGSRDVDDALPSVGGVVGMGLQGGGNNVVGRIGIDYDVRLDPTGRVNQTVLLTLRFVFGF